MCSQTATEEVVYSEATGWTPRPTELFGELSDECRQFGEALGYEYSPDGLWYRYTRVEAGV